jgi:sulfate adenylyltransferase subunit 1
VLVTDVAEPVVVGVTTMPTLRIATAGSVDDGKSTLIGRLLHDTKTVFEDQLAAVHKASARYGDGEVNLALLTDGLRAEREQGITIDVAHRYFATPVRSFIASLLGVHTIALAVNKMDLVGWDEGQFTAVVKELNGFVEALPTPVTVVAFPISALLGDNVVDASENTPWYAGPPLLAWLEQLDVAVEGTGATRLDVQRVIRPQGSDYRGYAGRLAGGRLAVGDAVKVLPSGRTSTVVGVQRLGRETVCAIHGDAITVELADDVDIARGDVLVLGNATATETVSGQVSWMIDRPLTPGSRWWFKHGTRVGRAVVESIEYRHDLHTLEQLPADELQMNDLALIRLSLSEPIVAEAYVTSREGGRLILVDEATNTTAGAVMITATT